MDEIWNYFTDEGSAIAKCSICSRELSFKRGCMTNLNRHLRFKHSINKSDKTLSTENSVTSSIIESSDLDESTANVSICQDSDRNETNTNVAGLKYTDENVWNHFTKAQFGRAKCSLCEKKFKIQGKSLSNLVKHLKTEHQNKNISLPHNDGYSSKIHTTIIDDSYKKTFDLYNSNWHNNSIESSEESMKDVWCYFTNKGRSKAICNTCSRELSFANNKISNLYRHLQFKHSIMLDVNFCNSKKIETNDTVEQSITDTENIDEIGDDNSNAPSDSETCIVASNSVQSGRIQNNFIWKYFKDVQNKRARCSLCRKIIFKGTSNKNLINHLQIEHSIEMPSSTDGKLRNFEDTELAHMELDEFNESDCSEVENHKLPVSLFIRDTIKSTVTNIGSNLSSIWNNTISETSSNKSKNVPLSNVQEESDENFTDATSVLSEIEVKSQPSPSTQNFMESTAISQVSTQNKLWNYFTDKGRGKAECKICSKPLFFDGNTPINLLRHLQFKHPTLFNTFDNTSSLESMDSDSNKTELDLSTTNSHAVESDTNRVMNYTGNLKSNRNFLETKDFMISKNYAPQFLITDEGESKPCDGPTLYPKINIKHFRLPPELEYYKNRGTQ